MIDPHNTIRHSRAGLTLVELLVVVLILTALVAAALPVMAPSGETRRIREAARSLHTAITVAQTKATESGRPYGVWLEKQSSVTGNASDHGAVLTVHYCQQPALFAGFSDRSAAVLTWCPIANTQQCDPQGNNPSSPPVQIQFGEWIQFENSQQGNLVPSPVENSRFLPQPLPPNFVRPGDTVEVGGNEYYLVGDQVDDFGYYLPIAAFRLILKGDALPTLDRQRMAAYLQGNLSPVSFYSAVDLVRISRQKWNYSFAPAIDNTTSAPPVWTSPQPYVIHRQPQKTGDPVEFPTGAAIDLESSGYGTVFFHDPHPQAGIDTNDSVGASNSSRVLIMFNPGGGIAYVQHDANYQNPANSNYLPALAASQSPDMIHLLVAKRELVGESIYSSSSTVDTRRAAWRDPESLWVSIAPRTGKVSTEVNEDLRNDNILTSYQELVAERLLGRSFARTGKTMGGR